MERRQTRRIFIKGLSAFLAETGLNAATRAQGSEYGPQSNEIVIPEIEVQLEVRGQIQSLSFTDLKVPRWQQNPEVWLKEMLTEFINSQVKDKTPPKNWRNESVSGIELTVGRPKNEQLNASTSKSDIKKGIRNAGLSILTGMGKDTAESVIGSAPTVKGPNGIRIRTGRAVSRGASGALGALGEYAREKRKKSAKDFSGDNKFLYSVPYLVADPSTRDKAPRYCNIYLDVDDQYINGYRKVNNQMEFVGTLELDGRISREDLSVSARAFAQIVGTLELSSIRVFSIEKNTSPQPSKPKKKW